MCAREAGRFHGDEALFRSAGAADHARLPCGALLPDTYELFRLGYDGKLDKRFKPRAIKRPINGKG